MTLETPCVFCARVQKDHEQVAAVGCCNNRCVIYAHATCVATRKSTLVWRKAQAKRGNRDAELCPHKGCNGRISFGNVRSDGTQRGDTAAAAFTHTLPVRIRSSSGANNASRQEVVTLPKYPCRAIRSDGQPCLRPAIANSTCVIHATKASITDVASQQVVAQEQVLCKPCDDASAMPLAAVQANIPMRTIGTQTDAIPFTCDASIQTAIMYSAENTTTEGYVETNLRFDLQDARKKLIDAQAKVDALEDALKTAHADVDALRHSMSRMREVHDTEMSTLQRAGIEEANRVRLAVLDDVLAAVHALA